MDQKAVPLVIEAAASGHSIQEKMHCQLPGTVIHQKISVISLLDVRISLVSLKDATPVAFVIERFHQLHVRHLQYQGF